MSCPDPNCKFLHAFIFHNPDDKLTEGCCESKHENIICRVVDRLHVQSYHYAMYVDAIAGKQQQSPLKASAKPYTPLPTSPYRKNVTFENDSSFLRPIIIGNSNATSPHSNATSPHSNATSPHSNATSPHSNATSPHSNATSPHSNGISTSRDPSPKTNPTRGRRGWTNPTLLDREVNSVEVHVTDKLIDHGRAVDKTCKYIMTTGRLMYAYINDTKYNISGFKCGQFCVGGNEFCAKHANELPTNSFAQCIEKQND